jgi:hypothetical protein
VLAAGELGYESDTKQAKIGNGSATWSALEYAPLNRNPTLQSIQLLTTGGNADTAGELAWNEDEQTLDVAKGGGTVLQVGQETAFLVYNDTATNDELIGWYDYGSAVDLLNGETFTITWDAAGILTLA